MALTVCISTKGNADQRQGHSQSANPQGNAMCLPTSKVLYLNGIIWVFWRSDGEKHHELVDFTFLTLS